MCVGSYDTLLKECDSCNVITNVYITKIIRHLGGVELFVISKECFNDPWFLTIDRHFSLRNLSIFLLITLTVTFLAVN